MKTFNRIAPEDTDKWIQALVTDCHWPGLPESSSPAMSSTHLIKYPARPSCLTLTISKSVCAKTPAVFEVPQNLFLSSPGVNQPWQKSNQGVQSWFALWFTFFCFYFSASGHANGNHSLSRDRSEADQPLFSQIFFAFFKDGNGICFVFPVTRNTPSYHTSKPNRPQLCCVISEMPQCLIPWTCVYPADQSGHQFDCPLNWIVLLSPGRTYYASKD